MAPFRGLADRGGGSSGDGGGPPVSDVQERQHRPLPQAQAFGGGDVPDHPALLTPGSVLHQHQRDVSPQGAADEPGHSELQGREEPEDVMLK